VRHSVLSFHLHIGLSDGISPTDFATKVLYEILISPPHSICSTHFILLDIISLIIIGKEYRLRSSTLYNFLHSPVTPSHLHCNIHFINTFLNIHYLLYSVNVRNQASNPYKADKTITLKSYDNYVIEAGKASYESLVLVGKYAPQSGQFKYKWVSDTVWNPKKHFKIQK
jgi:hypothetical protein